MLTLADAVHIAQDALKRGQQAERNVENSLSLPHKVLHSNGFRVSVHFYTNFPATLGVSLPASDGSQPLCGGLLWGSAAGQCPSGTSDRCLRPNRDPTLGQ